MNVVSRAGWGAVPARSVTPLSPGRVELFVVHHTTGSYAGAQSVRNIQQFHMGPQRGWADIGYNFLVGADGTIFEGRGWSRVGAHARNKNSVSIGVAYVGDGSLPVPDEAKRAIGWLAGEADRRFGRLRRVGHRDVGSTLCPGHELYRVVQSGLSYEPPKGDVPAKPEVSAESVSEAPERIVRLPSPQPPLGGPGDRPGERLVAPRNPVMDGWVARIFRRR